MRLRLRADAGVQTDGAGNVLQWSDQSGMGNDAVQNNAGSRPVLIPAAMNGFPIVRFQNKQLLLSNVMAGATAGEVFVVLRAANTVAPGAPYFNGYSLWRFSAENAPAGSGGFFPDTGGNIIEDFGRSSLVTFVNPGSPIDQPVLYNVVSSATEWTARLNAVVAYTTSSNTVGFRSEPVLGASQGFYSSGFQGDIAEIIIYDHSLMESERRSVVGYLTKKYALLISLPTPPTTPTNFAGVALSSTKVALSWGGSSNQNYNVERSLDGITWQAIASLNGNTSYTDTGLIAATPYSYRVKAVNDGGDTGFVGPVTAVTLAAGEADEVSQTGMKLWLKPEDLVQSAAGLAQWVDRSGGGNDATQTTLANRPQVVAGIINGQPAARFDGSSSTLNLPYFMSGSTSAEMFVVLKGSTVPGSCLFSSIGQGGPTYYPNSTGQISDGFGSTSQYDFSVSGTDLTQPRLYNVSTAANTWTATLDGNVLYSATTNAVNLSNGGFTPLLGAARGGAYFSLSNFLTADVAEIIIYDHALAASERQSVAGYLTRKYALSVSPATAPTNFAGAALSSTKVALSWTGSSSQIYGLERSSDGITWQTIASLNGNTSYTDTGLTAAMSYSYRIKAFSYGGSTDYVGPITVTAIIAGETNDIPQTGMKLWLKPEDLVQSSGGLARWADQSGGGNDATQATLASRPQVVVGAINGEPVARFDGSSSHLNLPYFMSGCTSAEMFVVLKGATASGACLFSSIGQGGATFYPNSSGQISDGFGSIAQYNFSSSGLDLTQPHLYNVSAAASTWTANLDGNVLYLTTANSVNFNDGGFTPLIGAARGGAYFSLSNFFSGDVAEIIIYDHALTPPERESVNFYLNQKYKFSSKNFTDLSAFTFDSDGDGISNADEIARGTNAYSADTDGDGVPDGWEVTHGFDPLVRDSQLDPDGDGVSNLEEYLRGTDPQASDAIDPASPVKLRVFQPTVR
jgi:hypothetical protein